MKKYIICNNGSDGEYCEIEYNLSNEQYLLFKDVFEKLNDEAVSGYPGTLYIELKKDN